MIKDTGIDDKEWHKMKDLVKLLNQERYEESVQYMNRHIDDLTVQTCYLFITGFDVNHSRLIPKPLENKIESFMSVSKGVPIRIQVRWTVMKSLMAKE